MRLNVLTPRTPDGHPMQNIDWPRVIFSKSYAPALTAGYWDTLAHYSSTGSLAVLHRVLPDGGAVYKTTWPIFGRRVAVVDFRQLGSRLVFCGLVVLTKDWQ